MGKNEMVRFKDEEEPKYVAPYYPIGSIFVSSSNKDPSYWYGGTWELIDKEYKSTRYRDDSVLTSINATANTMYITRSGHNIRFRLTWTTNVSIGDSAVDMFKIDLQKIGIYNFYMQILNGLMGSDGGNSIILYTFHYQTGMVNSNDVISKDGTGTCPTGATGYMNIVLPVDFENMIDSFCDKFYFKKIA